MSEEKKAPVPNIGQWWGVRIQMDGLDGAEGVRRLTEDDWAGADLLGEVDVRRVIDAAHDEPVVYLGAGEQPEPTPWMVEQLAGLLWEFFRTFSGEPRTWADVDEEPRVAVRSTIGMIMHGGAKPRRAEVFAVRHMHAVLRSLGYA